VSSYTLEIAAQDGWHLVTMTGRWDATTADLINRELADRLIPAHAKRILIDARQVVVATTAGEEYFIAGRLGGMGASRAVRVAVVMPPDAGDHRVYELAARNTGVNLRLLADYDAALGWVTEPT
jgi:hypothetical protein